MGIRNVTIHAIMNRGIEERLMNRTAELEVTNRELLATNSELRQQEQKLRSLLEALPLGVYECDTNGVLNLANEAFSRMMGYDRAEVPGMTIRDFMEPGPQRDALPAYLQRLMQEQPDPSPYICRAISKDGRSFDTQIDWTYKRTETGRIIGLVCIQSDISKRREMERMKDEMISTLSHEMRTPLTAMLGFTEYLLENTVDEEKSKEFLGTIYRETERLHELINNFLDLQRMKANQTVYHFESLQMGPLLYESTALFASASKAHRLIVDVPPNLPAVCGDEVRLHQVLNNLLSNAIKFSPKGGEVTLGARREEDAVVVWVKDAGIGIPPAMLEKIFDRFYRVDSSESRRTGGTGLGLALVREIVTAHGGRVWVESVKGKGSTFFFSLPVMREPVALRHDSDVSP